MKKSIWTENNMMKKNKKKTDMRIIFYKYQSDSGLFISIFYKNRYSDERTRN